MLHMTEVPAPLKNSRRTFVGGSDARIIMGDDEAALVRLWREKRGEIEPEENFVPVHLLRLTERPRSVRLEFDGGISAEISREQYTRQKDNKEWQVEFPPAALRVF